MDKNLTSSLLVTYAETLLHLKQLDRAVKLIETSLQLEPEQTGAYYLLYKIAENRQDLDSAEKWLTVLFKKNKIVKKKGKSNSTDVIIDDEKLLQTLAKVHIRQKNNKKLFDVCHKIIKMNKNNVLANRWLANYQMDHKNFEKAFSHIRQISGSFSAKDEKYLELLGMVLIKNNQFEKAIYIYNKLLEINKANENALKKLVGLLAKTGHRKEAEQILILYKNSSQEK